MFWSPLPFDPPPFPLPPGVPDERSAAWRQRWHCASVDDVWLLRELAEEKANRARRSSWETRFRVLGPRAHDTTPTAAE